VTILHVIAPGAAGGAEGVVRALAMGHRRMGHSTAVAAILSRRDVDHPFLSGLDRAGVLVAPVRLASRAYVAERREVAELIRRVGPDVVHTHGYRADVVDGAAARRHGIPAVSTVHGFTGGGWKNLAYERLQLRCLRRFDAVVAVSRPLAKQLEAAGIGRDRIRVVQNALPRCGTHAAPADARRRLGVHDGIFHVGWVGRLSREKGIDLLLDALAELTDVRLVVSVIGDGPQRQALQRRARELRLDGQILWHGVIPEAARLLSAFDLFVLSSRTEGTPLVLGEAIDAGVPVAAFRVGGVPGILAEDEAFLVQPEDPTALALAIRRAHDEPGTARERARLARRSRALRFDADTWLRRHLEIYGEVSR
jgi:glycosyltransferase involved in cell wall biosynthesis